MKYKDTTFEGSTFPDAPYRWDTPPKFTKELRNEYLSELKKLALPRGFELLLEAMTAKEGFYKGTRSHSNNNPATSATPTGAPTKNCRRWPRASGCRRSSSATSWPAKNRPLLMGKPKLIAPYYSAEIARNQKRTVWSPGCPATGSCLPANWTSS